MYILYNSRDEKYKSPFGTLYAGEPCRFCVQVPAELDPVAVILTAEGLHIPLERTASDGVYVDFSATAAIEKPGLYFYHFFIRDRHGEYSLFDHGE